MSLRDAETSLEKAQNDWRVRSKNTGFTEPDQVKKSASARACRGNEKEIDEFLDTSKQLSANISRVTDKLAERRISEEEWTASVSLLKQAEAESGAAMEEKGAQAKLSRLCKNSISALKRLRPN